jgi:hypothetical protein
MLRRLLRSLLGRPAVAPNPDFGRLPPQPSDDAEGWLMEHLGNGVTLHFPPSERVERGPAVDLTIPPVPQRAATSLRWRQVFSAAGNRHDGTRTP